MRSLFALENVHTLRFELEGCLVVYFGALGCIFVFVLLQLRSLSNATDISCVHVRKLACKCVLTLLCLQSA